MSAGGPIIEPKAKMILLTPICPHTLNARSIVLSADDEIVIRITNGRNGEKQDMEVNFDGSVSRNLTTGDEIKITKSEKVTQFIRLSHVSFLEILSTIWYGIRIIPYIRDPALTQKSRDGLFF